MSTFPSTLPAPSLPGYSGSQSETFIRTNMAAGAPRQRQQYTATLENMTFSFLLTAAQMATFRGFWKNTINGGTDWFTMMLDIGNGMTTYDVRFTKSYQYTIIQNQNWQVSCTAEVRNA